MSEYGYRPSQPEPAGGREKGGMPSSETPKKQSRKRSKRSLAGMIYPVALLIFLVVSVALSWMLQDRSVISQIEVRAPGFTTPEQVLEASQLVQGMAAAEVRPLEVQARIDVLPWVAESRVRLVPGGRVLVEVREREPLALLVEGNRMMLVDADGVALQIPAGFHPDLPLLYGFRLPLHGQPVTGARFPALSGFLTALHQSPTAGLKISEIGWHPQEGVIALSREHAVRLVFGEDDFPEKVQSWESFYRQVAPVKGMAAFTRLDFRFRDQVVARHS